MANNKKYAEVAPMVPIPPAGRQTYTYAIPAELRQDVVINSVVWISLGKRRVKGLVVGFSKVARFPRIKAIEKIFGANITKEQLFLAKWISEVVSGGLGYTARLMLPRGKVNFKKDESEVEKGKITALSNAVIAYPLSARIRKLRNDITDAIVAGKQVLVLVPEQDDIDGWVAELGRGTSPRAASYHSKLAASAEAKTWSAIWQGDSMVVVGTRRALYLPWRKLDLVVVDDENHFSHKIDRAYPGLANWRVAEQLADIFKARMIWSGASASLRLARKIDEGGVKTVLNEPLRPKISIISRSAKDFVEKAVLPQKFLDQLGDSVRKKDTILLVVNKQGYWSTLWCKDCQAVLKCPDCHASLVVSGRGGRPQVRCRVCGFGPTEGKCSVVATHNVVAFGVGQTRVEQTLRDRFPKATIEIFSKSRVGREKKNKSGARFIIGAMSQISQMRKLQIDQVAIINPESVMLSPSLVAEERMMENIMRLAQRADLKKIFLVSMRPNYVKDVFGDGIDGAIKRMLKERRKLKRPPYQDLIKLIYGGKSAKAALTKAEKYVDLVAQESSKMKVSMYGPYSSKEKNEAYILITGEAVALKKIYKTARPDRVDLDPERFL